MYARDMEIWEGYTGSNFLFLQNSQDGAVRRDEEVKGRGIGETDGERMANIHVESIDDIRL